MSLHAALHLIAARAGAPPTHDGGASTDAILGLTGGGLLAGLVDGIAAARSRPKSRR